MLQMKICGTKYMYNLHNLHYNVNYGDYTYILYSGLSYCSMYDEYYKRNILYITNEYIIKY